MYFHAHADAQEHTETCADTGVDLFGPTAFISLAKLLPEGDVVVWMGNHIQPRQ